MGICGAKPKGSSKQSNQTIPKKENSEGNRNGGKNQNGNVVDKSGDENELNCFREKPIHQQAIVYPIQPSDRLDVEPNPEESWEDSKAIGSYNNSKMDDSNLFMKNESNYSQPPPPEFYDESNDKSNPSGFYNQNFDFEIKGTPIYIENIKNPLNVLMSRLHEFLESAIKKDTYVFSPIGFQVCMSIIQEGQVGESKDQIEDFLGVSGDPKQRKDIIAKFIEQIDHVNGNIQNSFACQFSNTNALFYGEFIPKDSYISHIQNNYNTIFQKNCNTIMQKAEKAEIDKQIRDNTNNHMQSMHSEIDINTLCIIQSQVTFKPQLKLGFKNSFIKTSEFLNRGQLSQSKQVEFMCGNSINCTYKMDSQNSKYIKQPCMDNQQSIVFYQPDETAQSMNSRLMLIDSKEKLNSITIWDDLIDSDCIDIQIPLFEIQSEFNFKNILLDMGIDNLYDVKYKSNFQNLFSVDDLAKLGQDSNLCEFIQKTFFSIDFNGGDNEDNCEVTVNNNKFNCNRPFSFYIIDNKENILFNGLINEL